MAGQIGCGGLGVSGQGGDSVIHVNQNIVESVNFPESEGLTQSISESVSVIVT